MVVAKNLGPPWSEITKKKKIQVFQFKNIRHVVTCQKFQTIYHVVAGVPVSFGIAKDFQ